MTCLREYVLHYANSLTRPDPECHVHCECGERLSVIDWDVGVDLDVTVDVEPCPKCTQRIRKIGG